MSTLLKRILHFKICKAEVNYNKLNPKNWKCPSFKKIIKNLAFLIILLGALIIVSDEYGYQFGESFYDQAGTASESEEGSDCNTFGMELRGSVVTYITPDSKDEEGDATADETSSEELVYLIDQAGKDPEIKAIVLEVDSYGGSAVAAEEISQALKRANKPTVAFVRNAATSAAYWAASGADIIFASSLSDIGGIGVTMSYLDNAKKNDKDGLTYNSLSTGKYKDYGDPDKPLTDEERRLVMRDLEINHDIFVKAISENRNLPLEKVKRLADGSSMPGQMALENGLIDKIGGLHEVDIYLKDKIGEEVSICW